MRGQSAELPDKASKLAPRVHTISLTGHATCQQGLKRDLADGGTLRLGVAVQHVE